MTADNSSMDSTDMTFDMTLGPVKKTKHNHYNYRVVAVSKQWNGTSSDSAVLLYTCS